MREWGSGPVHIGPKGEMVRVGAGCGLDKVRLGLFFSQIVGG